MSDAYEWTECMRSFDLTFAGRGRHHYSDEKGDDSTRPTRECNDERWKVNDMSLNVEASTARRIIGLDIASVSWNRLYRRFTC